MYPNRVQMFIILTVKASCIKHVLDYAEIWIAENALIKKKKKNQSEYNVEDFPVSLCSEWW